MHCCYYPAGRRSSESAPFCRRPHCFCRRLPPSRWTLSSCSFGWIQGWDHCCEVLSIAPRSRRAKRNTSLPAAKNPRTRAHTLAWVSGLFRKFLFWASKRRRTFCFSPQSKVQRPLLQSGRSAMARMCHFFGASQSQLHFGRLFWMTGPFKRSSMWPPAAARSWKLRSHGALFITECVCNLVFLFSASLRHWSLLRTFFVAVSCLIVTKGTLTHCAILHIIKS